MPAASGRDTLVASVVDVGSNSVPLLTVEVGSGGRARQRDAALATTALGSGLRAGGDLDPAACARTRAAVVAMCERARAHAAARVWAFATGAVRVARDGHAFAAALEQAAACPVEVLSGETEAALSYGAVSHALGSGDRPVLVVDLGGATTELTLGHGAVIDACTSLPLGALVLTQAAETAAAVVDRVLAGSPLPAAARAAGAGVIASGGTVTALAALDLCLAAYDPARVHGHTLAVARLREIARGAPTVLPGVLDPGRAAILPAGALVLEGVARAAGAASLRVSDHGVRHGYLRRRLIAEGVDADLRALWD